MSPLVGRCRAFCRLPHTTLSSISLIAVRTTPMPPQKRKSSNRAAGPDESPNGATHASKRSRQDDSRYHPNAQEVEDFGIVLREFYPPEMSNERCEAYNNGTLERPIETLQKAYIHTAEERKAVRANLAVVYWFKSDLRLHDNRGLQTAYRVAQEHQIPLICLYILSPEDLTAHLVSPAKVDLTLRTLDQLKRDLSELDIPLYIDTQERRANIPSRILDLCQRWGANHIFANLEYEVDELRREAKLVRMCAENGIKFEAAHDTCVVTPGALSSQQGRQYAVYTPWYRSWVAFLFENPENLEIIDEPGPNPGDARKQFAELFDCPIPAAPANKRLSGQKAAHLRRLYPAGEHEALRRLEAFLEEKATAYADSRNTLAGEGTSSLSPYFANGALSARTAVAQARKANKNQLSRNDQGFVTWISEVAWRDFYKHVLVHWPFICMNKCFKPNCTNIEWEYDQDQFNAWSEGRTGFPIVDAAMRQMNQDAWMHNRARMVVSSFLSKDLLIDWRRGERYFMEQLVDGDFASNHGGWGFGSSTGVDPQPYFRIFNPLRQSERFDPEGEYIRKWVPELREIKGPAIHAPYEKGAGAIAKRNGYPEPIVDHSQSREKALSRYKSALQGS